MRILFLGDVVGRAGRDALNAHLKTMREIGDWTLSLLMVKTQPTAWGCLRRMRPNSLRQA